MPDLDRLIADYRAGIVAALAENAERAYLVGDLIGQRRIHRAARGITNAKKRVKDYDFDPPKAEGVFRLTFGEVAKEALAYLDTYTAELERGGTTIGGTWVPWLEDHSAGMRKSIADALATGVREGLGHDDVVRSLGKVLDGERWKLERIARTETSRIQRTGMINRYTDAGVPKVRRLLGANPCPECLADKDGIYEIDSVPEDHVGGFCDWQPLVTAPIDRDAVMPADEVDKLLSGDALPDVREFVPAKTVEDAAKYTREVLGIKDVETTGLHLDAVNAYNKRIAELKERFPGTIEKFQRFSDGQSAYEKYYNARVSEIGKKLMAEGKDPNAAFDMAKQLLTVENMKSSATDATAFARTDLSFGKYDLCGVYINRRVFGGAFNLADYNKNGRHLEDIGYFAKGGGTFDGTITHEVGHLVFAEAMDDRATVRAIEVEWSAFRELSPTDAKNALSEYAGTDWTEFGAEAFAEYVCAPNPRPIAQRVGRLIEDGARKMWGKKA